MHYYHGYYRPALLYTGSSRGYRRGSGSSKASRPRGRGSSRGGSRSSRGCGCSRGRGRGSSRGRGRGSRRGRTTGSRGGQTSGTESSTGPELHWKKVDQGSDRPPIPCPFSEPTGPTLQLPPNPQPIDFFHQLIDTSVIRLLVDETNR